MPQTGLKINTSSEIDNLAYTYNTNSNKLLKVVDTVTAENQLGDFYDGTSVSGNDYTHDANKNIANITYNCLNLPSVIKLTPWRRMAFRISEYAALASLCWRITIIGTSPAS